MLTLRPSRDLAYEIHRQGYAAMEAFIANNVPNATNQNVLHLRGLAEKILPLKATRGTYALADAIELATNNEWFCSDEAQEVATKLFRMAEAIEVAYLTAYLGYIPRHHR